MSFTETSVAINAAANALRELPLAELLAGLQSASREQSSAYTLELVRRFQPLVRRYWRHQRRGDYQDFLHEVLVNLFKALPLMRDPKAFPGFFRRIVVTTAADLWRAQEPVHAALEDIDLESWAEAFDRDLTVPILVRSYLERLPPREREVVELAYLEDLDSGEIGRRLGLSPGAVRMTKSRGINKLREIVLADEQIEQGR